MTFNLEIECLSFRCVAERVLLSLKITYDLIGKACVKSGSLIQRIKKIMSRSSNCIIRNRGQNTSRARTAEMESAWIATLEMK